MAEWKTAGKVRMVPKGTWNSNTAYLILDCVSNQEGTAYYVAKSDVPAGTALTNTTYWDSIANMTSFSDKTFIQRGSLTSEDDIDDFKTPGQWVLYASADPDVDPRPDNWPSDYVGRLLVFGSDTGERAFCVQAVIDIYCNVYVRYGRSNNWTEWTNLAVESRVKNLESLTVKAIGSEVTASSSYSNINDLPVNTIANISAVASTSLTNFPNKIQGAATIITTNGVVNAQAGKRQVCYFQGGVANANGAYADRMYVSGAWTDWVYHGYAERVVKVRADGTGEFRYLGIALQNLIYANRNIANPYYRYVIDVGEGTFSISNIADTIERERSLSDDQKIMDIRGAFLPPYTTLRGRGKDKTIITFYYNGTDTETMSMVSGLNVPYTSTIEDLTLSVKNIRYAIHSDNPLHEQEPATAANVYLNNNKITLKNVKLEHLGFDNGYSSSNLSYFAPAAWGGGTWNATDREFINCDFISSQYTAWLNHNRAWQTDRCEITFKNCTFCAFTATDPYYNGQAGSALTSACALISWGSGVKSDVLFENCIASQNVSLTIASGSAPDYSADAVIDYDVVANNDLYIIESTVNDAHLAANFRTSSCVLAKYTSSGGATAYTPVSQERIYFARSYSNTIPLHGIALNSCAKNEMVYIQMRGYVSLKLLTSSTFALGDYLGYSNGAWVVDTEHPILRVIDNGNTAMII